MRSKVRRDMARVARRRNSRRRGKVIPCILVLSALSAAVYLVLFTDVMTIRDINYYGGSNLPLERLKTVEADILGRNLFSPHLRKLRDELLTLPAVKDVVFKRRPLHGIECYIIERKPVALIMDGGPVGVDKDGVVLSGGTELQDVDLPIITGIGADEVQKESGRRMLRKAMTVLNLYRESGINGELELSEIHLNGEDVILVVGKRGTIVRFGRDRYTEAVRKLKAIYKILGRSKDFPLMIDLRFDGQVVVR